ncbi:MAG: 8-oxoguanine DNA glycosylase [Candidatus Omnitrophica bacterium]|nr:8-oxoguanine DNA glycosylase [Candidatus Omnitrophota bacterium]
MFEIPAAEFSLQASLSSGQTFRWRAHEGWCYGFIGPSVAKVRQEGDRLLCETSDPALSPERLRRYFALDLDLPEVLSSINVDMQVHQAIGRHRGLRVLRQDGWETLASFICAAFNNIKRIEGMIERLCQAYGEPVALNGFRGFSFPRPEAVAGASERRLRSLGLGYRAPYLKATARLVADGGLPAEHLRRVDYDAAKRALLGCDGVGDKVADCVALFGFEKYEAFPIDVWMERVMRYYFRHRRMTRARLHAYARRHFGPYAGYAQQYLYHDIRTARGPLS